MITEEIPAALAGERLDRIVALLAEVSRAEAVRLIELGAVTLNDDVATAGKLRIVLGSTVTIDTTLVSVPAPPQPDASVDFGVIHLDDHLVVIDKPAGLVVHPATGNETGTLVNGLLARFPEVAGIGADPVRPGIVHRLDGGTSGLLIIARTPEAHSVLAGMMKAHEVNRVYDALVWGTPESPTGTIDAPIGRDSRNPLQMAIVATGRHARTHFKVESAYATPPVARLTCELETGRTHQIRVHLAAVGHPVVGDSMYGDNRPMIGLTRPFLHAKHLGFDHPITGVPMEFDSPLPADLAALLSRLG